MHFHEQTEQQKKTYLAPSFLCCFCHIFFIVIFWFFIRTINVMSLQKKLFKISTHMYCYFYSRNFVFPTPKRTGKKNYQQTNVFCIIFFVKQFQSSFALFCFCCPCISSHSNGKRMESTQICPICRKEVFSHTMTA